MQGAGSHADDNVLTRYQFAGNVQDEGFFGPVHSIQDDKELRNDIIPCSGGERSRHLFFRVAPSSAIGTTQFSTGIGVSYLSTDASAGRPAIQRNTCHSGRFSM